MFDGSTPATPSLASALIAFGFVGAWETNVAAGRSVLDEGACDVMAGDASLAGKPLTLDESLARIHPEDRDWVFDRIRQVRETGGSFSADFRIVTEGGDIRWIRNRGHVTRTETGMHGHGAFFDVTDTRAKLDVLPRPKLRLLPPADPLEQAADQILAARVAFDRTGQKRLRTLVDTLLLEVGRALARRQGA
ncbi:PAS domain-containing protein [Methylobacterium sp. WL30]|uniref:PAS domain-containing protein n=1 Tax=unclassified Methylobacterium TaxID=2615210 RepID=UPI0011CB8FAA|nr:MULTISPECIES: PAS domain-containing protein [unclassified Methylobacterium]TXN33863.1 PAS domain-containing protein [Methylobacterium sp. WL93]TXN50824.1 PAS domain-containing protein [Methylobacterium sp. WL119]TXN66621.1 PAS domain-containing protein [Methylobacterium sp. WL30]